jgi:hypothetical protein
MNIIEFYNENHYKKKQGKHPSKSKNKTTLPRNPPQPLDLFNNERMKAFKTQPVTLPNMSCFNGESSKEERRPQAALQSFRPQSKHSIISNRSSSKTLLCWICSSILALIFDNILTNPGRRGNHLLLYFDCVQPNHHVANLIDDTGISRVIGRY